MKNIKAISISTCTVIVVVTFLTIISELSSPFKSFLASLTGHHWVTKSVISVVLFFVLYFLLSKVEDNLDVLKEATIVIIVTILGSLTIFGFYVWHFFA